MQRNPGASLPVAAVVRRPFRQAQGPELVEGLASGVTTAATFKAPDRNRAFSLIEVVIAVGLFAASVTVVIALLPALTRHGAIAQDTLAAQRLPDALKVELSRLAAFGGFDALAGQIPLASLPADGLALVAPRDAARLHSLDYLPPATGEIPAGEQYFLIECWRFPDEPLRFDAQKHFLALAVRVSWPYRLPGSTAPTAESARTHVMFTVSMTR